MTALHYSGHLIQGDNDPRWRLDRAELESIVQDILRTHHVSAVFGSLACGADLLVSEVASKMDIPVHAFLPFSAERFKNTSVLPGGNDEVLRFERMLPAIKSLTVMPDLFWQDDHVAFNLSSDWAISSAMAAAKMQRTNALQLVLWDGQSKQKRVSSNDVDKWRYQDMTQILLRLPSLEISVSGPGVDDPLALLHVATFNVRNEITRAWVSSSYGLKEAAVMYAARLMEGVAREAAKQAGIYSHTQSVHDLLEHLASCSLIDRNTLLSAHMVRRAGNDVRHVQRVLGEAEHVVNLAFLKNIITWYTTQFRYGPRLDAVDVPSTQYDDVVNAILCSAQLRKLKKSRVQRKI